MHGNDASLHEFERYLRELGREVRDPARGFVDPASPTWRVIREAVHHAAGPRALLLQFAHPMVAEGVAAHSNFREDLLGRTLRTFTIVYRMVFGRRDEAITSALAIRAVHGRVWGVLSEDVGWHRSGTPYAANEPRLLTWVWATLIEGSLFAYERYVAPLAPAERACFYRDSVRLARLFGLQEDTWSADLDGFHRWFADTIASGEIAVGSRARTLADALFYHSPLLRPVSPVARILAAGTLPPKVREGFGLPWGPGAQLAFRGLEAGIRTGVRMLPEVVRVLPMARQAEARYRALGRGHSMDAVAIGAAREARAAV
jgi:uncharacterized protein (DUF2236 family)